MLSHSSAAGSGKPVVHACVTASGSLSALHASSLGTTLLACKQCPDSTLAKWHLHKQLLMSTHWMQVSQVQYEIDRRVRAYGKAADPACFKQIMRPMVDYMYKSMPNVQQASTCRWSCKAVHNKSCRTEALSISLISCSLALQLVSAYSLFSAVHLLFALLSTFCCYWAESNTQPCNVHVLAYADKACDSVW